MSPASADRPSTSDTLLAIYQPIRSELEEVERLLQEEVRSDHPFIGLLMKHGFRLGGKRMRPALVVFSGLACGAVQPQHLRMAAAIEMVHTATLIHDDVLDEAEIRRHLDTVNARWGNEVSVLLGDYLFARAICLVNSLSDSRASEVMGDASRVMCEGELRQVECRGNYAMSEDLYTQIIAAKTAALIAACCELGAHLAGGGAAAQAALISYGRHLGIAFQITDDLLDLSGDEATTGKSLGTDLVKQKPTLPLIRLLQQATAQDRERLLAILTGSDNHRPEALRPYLERSDALDYARSRAAWYAGQAAAELAVLPPTPARDSLARLAEFVVGRRQ